MISELYISKCEVAINTSETRIRGATLTTTRTNIQADLRQEHRSATEREREREIESYQSDFAYFRKACRDRSWCVCGSAEMPCALRVLGPISCALGKTD